MASSSSSSIEGEVPAAAAITSSRRRRSQRQRGVTAAEAAATEAESDHPADLPEYAHELIRLLAGTPSIQSSDFLAPLTEKQRNTTQAEDLYRSYELDRMAAAEENSERIVDHMAGTVGGISLQAARVVLAHRETELNDAIERAEAEAAVLLGRLREIDTAAAATAAALEKHPIPAAVAESGPSVDALYEHLSW